MNQKCDQFVKGNKTARDKLNQLVNTANALGNIRGDNLIHVVSNGNGYSFTFDVQKLISLLPLKAGGSSTGISRVFCSAGASTGNTIICYTGNPYPIKWDETVIYSANAIVCIDRTENVYVSLQGNNLNRSPLTETLWWTEIKNYDSTTIYVTDDLVFGTDGLIYQSQADDNENFLLSDTDYWLPYNVYSNSTSYSLNSVVHGSDNLYYTSLQSGNTGNTPQTSPEWWTVYPYITVTCKIYEGGENLIYSTPLLATKDELKVTILDGLYRSLETFTPICGGEA